MKSMDPSRVVEVASAAIRLDPENFAAREALATALYELEEYRQSAHVARRMIALKPESIRAHEVLASSLLDLEEPEEAILVAQELIKLEPNSTQALEVLAWSFYVLDHYEQAAQAATQLIELEPDNSTGREVLASALLELRDADGAEMAAERWLELNPDSIGNFAIGLYTLDRFKDAARAARRWIDRDPGAGDAYLVLVRSLVAMGDYDDAVAYVRSAIELDVGDTADLIGSLFDRGQTDKVEEAVRRAQEHDPKDPSLRVVLEWI